MRRLNNIWHDFTSLFFPDSCAGCNTSLLGTEEILCTRCLATLPKTSQCKNPSGNPVWQRLLGRVSLQHAYAYLYFTKGGMVQNMLHKLKYHNRKDIGQKLGEVLAEELLHTGIDLNYNMIVPVPLHQTRLRKRGYNQSTCFAEGLSQGLGIPVREDIMERITATNTQTRKSRIKRWENVNEVFRLRAAHEVKEQHILLVDDVITTGATIEACARELVNASAIVSVAFIAAAR